MAKQEGVVPRYMRELQPVPLVGLKALTTRQLMGLRGRLLRVEESPDASDRLAHEIDPALIQFKSDPRWPVTYQAVLGELGKREHLPNGPERLAQRQAQARRRHGRKDRPQGR